MKTLLTTQVGFMKCKRFCARLLRFQYFHIFHCLAIILVVELSTCKSSGRFGPSTADCSATYNSTEAASVIKMIDDPNLRGVQMWRVPSENYYT